MLIDFSEEKTRNIASIIVISLLVLSGTLAVFPIERAIAQEKELNNPPVANFTYSPTNPSVFEGITFNASSSHDLDENIL